MKLELRICGRFQGARGEVHRVEVKLPGAPQSGPDVFMLVMNHSNVTILEEGNTEELWQMTEHNG